MVDGEQEEVVEELKRDETFDLVVGNPPYVAKSLHPVGRSA